MSEANHKAGHIAIILGVLLMAYGFVYIVGGFVSQYATLIILAMVLLTIAAAIGAGWYVVYRVRLHFDEKGHERHGRYIEREMGLTQVRMASAQVVAMELENQRARVAVGKDAHQAALLQNHMVIEPGIAAVINADTYQHVFNARSSRAPVQVEVPEEAPPVMLPAAPPWSAMQHLVHPGKIVFGYGQGGPVIGDVDDFLSTGVMGLPKTGKSTTLFYLIAQLLINNATIICWDPSNGLIRLSSFITMIDLDEMPKHAYVVEDILKRRLAELKECLIHKQTYNPPPLLLVIDELPAIAEQFEKGENKDPHVMTVIRKCTMEGRKVKIYIILAGQSFAAKQMDGSMLKNNLYCRYVLDCEQLEAQMAGLNLSEGNEIGKANRQFLTTIRGHRGVAILDRREGGVVPEIVAIPETTAHDVEEVMRKRGRVVDSLPLPQARSIAAPHVAMTPHQAPTPIRHMLTPQEIKQQRDIAMLSDQEKAVIHELFMEGVPRHHMFDTMRRKHHIKIGGKKYPGLQAYCDVLQKELEHQTHAS